MGHYTRLSDDELLARTKDEPEAFGEPTLELTYADGGRRVYEGRQAK